MKIIKIKKVKSNAHVDYVDITFKNWLGKEFVKSCFFEHGNIYTCYCDNGKSIPVSMWPIVSNFLTTYDGEHFYK